MNQSPTSHIATREDFGRLGDAIQAMAEASRVASEAQIAILKDLVESAKQPHGQVQQVNVPQAPAPRPERLAWAMFVMVSIMATITSGAVVAALFQGQRITDLRSDMLAERQSRELLEIWADQESKAVRSYITNGKLAPMAPRSQLQLKTEEGGK